MKKAWTPPANETRITFDELAKQIAFDGRVKAAKRRLRRYWKRGLSIAVQKHPSTPKPGWKPGMCAGVRVKMKARRIGAFTYTTVEEFRRFEERTQANGTG